MSQSILDRLTFERCPEAGQGFSRKCGQGALILVFLVQKIQKVVLRLDEVPKTGTAIMAQHWRFGIPVTLPPGFADREWSDTQISLPAKANSTMAEVKARAVR